MTRRITIPFASALALIRSYLVRKVAEQIRAVAFIVVYLWFFQVAVLSVPPVGAAGVAGGVAMVVFGLTFFLEGLFLGLMPLGRKIGVLIPAKAGIVGVVVFGLLLGFGVTLAEPAIQSLRSAGSGVQPWSAGLLFALLEVYPEQLMMTIAGGVGVAVALGMARFHFGWPVKPLILVIIPVLLALTIVCSLNPRLRSVVGLAWDSGAVTTGVVTVPLVLALGLGVNRAAGRTTEGGFGVILLASALPVAAVMILAVIVAPSVPDVATEAEFFAPERRAAVERYLGGPDAVARVALTRASAGRFASLFDNDVDRQAALRRLAPQTGLSEGAQPQSVADGPSTIFNEILAAVRAVVPLTALLAFVLYVLLRSRTTHSDEVLLGVVLTLVGMVLLTPGIRLGLVSLGDEVGSGLPQMYRQQAQPPLVIADFDRDVVLQAVDATGTRTAYFLFDDGNGPRYVAFDQQSYDPASRTYRIPPDPPRAGWWGLSGVGIALVLVFAFGLGYGSTLAEPALSALGRSVEAITVGTIRADGIRTSVSLGVGLGLAVGVVRLLFWFPVAYLIVPVYVLLLLLTAFSADDVCAIAWDSGGVTTGPVTVPLVLALGLGIGREAALADGFGVLASASAFPILTVLGYGLLIRFRQRRFLAAGTAEQTND